MKGLSYMKKNRWKNLQTCRDFKELRTYFPDELLDSFEIEIEDYLNGEIDPEDETLAICWYEGLITVEDLADEYGCYKK
jgi:hypothetical protein